MSDLEMVRLCAEAMGLELVPWCPGTSNESWALKRGRGRKTYDPLHDDAQAMALVKRFELQISHHRDPKGNVWLAAFSFTEISNFVGHHTEHADLNRAIVECVAKMQAMKEPK